MPANADQDGAVSAAETNNETQTPAPAQPQRQPRSREGGQQRDDRPRVERRRDERRFADDDYDRPRRSYDDRPRRHDDYGQPPRQSWLAQHGVVVLWAVVLVIFAIILYKGWNESENRKAMTPVVTPPTSVAVVTPPAPASVGTPHVEAGGINTTDHMTPDQLVALMGTPGSGVKVVAQPNDVPKGTVVVATLTPNGQVWMPNQGTGRPLSAKGRPGERIPLGYFRFAPDAQTVVNTNGITSGVLLPEQDAYGKQLVAFSR